MNSDCKGVRWSFNSLFFRIIIKEKCQINYAKKWCTWYQPPEFETIKIWMLFDMDMNNKLRKSMGPYKKEIHWNTQIYLFILNSFFLVFVAHQSFHTCYSICMTIKLFENSSLYPFPIETRNYLTWVEAWVDPTQQTLQNVKGFIE